MGFSVQELRSIGAAIEVEAPVGLKLAKQAVKPGKKPRSPLFSAKKLRVEPVLAQISTVALAQAALDRAEDIVVIPGTEPVVLPPHPGEAASAPALDHAGHVAPGEANAPSKSSALSKSSEPCKSSEPSEADTPDAVFDLARLMLDQILDQAREASMSGDFAAAEALALEVLDQAPHNGRAYLRLGIVALERDETACIDYFVRAAELDIRQVVLAQRNFETFAKSHPSVPGMDEARQKIEHLAAKVAAAQAERRGHRPGAKFLPAGLDGPLQAGVLGHFAGNPDIVSACLVQRRVSQWTHLPAYFLTMELRKGWDHGSLREVGDARERLRLLGTLLEQSGTLDVLYPRSLLGRYRAWRMRQATGAMLYASRKAG